MNGVDALSATAVTASFGALFLIVASLLVEGSAGVQAALHSGWSAWGALLFLAFGATALAYAWFFDGVKRLGAGAAAGYITLVPVVGVAVSALLLHEALDTSLLIGGTLAVLGTAIMQRGRR